MYKYIHGFWKDKQKDYKKKLFLNHFKAVSVWKVSTWFKLLPKTKLTVKCIKLCEPQIKIWNKTCWYAKAVNGLNMQIVQQAYLLNYYLALSLSIVKTFLQTWYFRSIANPVVASLKCLWKREKRKRAEKEHKKASLKV